MFVEETLQAPRQSLYAGRLDDDALAATISNGRPGTAMPAWGGLLSPTEIQSLVTLIRNWDSLDETDLAQMAEQAQVEYGNVSWGAF